MDNRVIFFHILLTITFMGFFTMIKGQSLEFSGWSTDDLHYISVNIEDGKIVKIISSTGSEDADKIYIGPGLIDTQVNGYRSISFSDEGLTVEKVSDVTHALWEEGVTTYFPTLITSDPDVILKNLKILAQAVADPLLAHSMPGYFLEGPYISPIDGFRGAHDKNWVRNPDWNEFMGFIQAANNRIIQVGLAPEMDGAMDFIRNCAMRGIYVALAHHNATADQIEEAVNNGARVSTHLGNGCANLIHRHLNPLWPQLANDQITPSIIADGHHLNAEELQVFYKVKGPDQLFLVSDATKLAGMPPGEYTWDGKTVVMTEDGMLQYPEQQVLAGASFPVRYGVGNMMHYVNIPLEEAYRMASQIPSQVYQLYDRGLLKTGKSADLILFKIDHGQMIILKTIVQGKVVFER
jgi:N-acetylglucosamine-6-phosphate deacetylase